MIIPSIDLMNGRAVQLIGGKTKALEASEDPIELARKFGMIGEIAVIDLDAVMGKGSNEAVIREMLKVARCRVGGGIRNAETAINWLNAGAAKVILGTMAKPEILSELPRDRVMAAVDMKGGKLAVQGWQEVTQTDGIARMIELRDYVSGFLITNIDIEGSMGGFDISQATPILAAAGNARVTMAGGITTAKEIAALDAIDADAQVGMAIYTGKLQLSDCISKMLKSDRADELIPTIVTDENGIALGLTYSSKESLAAALNEQAGIYFSRKRGLWRKGETSGATQKLLRVDMDCDRDTLRFTVQQNGLGFCHTGTESCFGNLSGLPAFSRRIDAAMRSTDENSYTKKLIASTQLLNDKIIEEALELTQADNKDEIIFESADLIYFTAVKLAASGIGWDDIFAELDRRAAAVTRRDNSKRKSA